MRAGRWKVDARHQHPADGERQQGSGERTEFDGPLFADARYDQRCPGNAVESLGSRQDDAKCRDTEDGVRAHTKHCLWGPASELRGQALCWSEPAQATGLASLACGRGGPRCLRLLGVHFHFDDSIRRIECHLHEHARLVGQERL